MKKQDYEKTLAAMAEIADYLGDNVEDLFNARAEFLNRKMVYEGTVLDQALKSVTTAQYNAVQALRTLRRTLEDRSHDIAYHLAETESL